MVDISKLSFARGFEPKEIQVVLDKGRTILLAFRNNYAGRDDFNIREIYEEFGEWKPGKGISVPMAKKAELLTALKSLS